MTDAITAFIAHMRDCGCGPADGVQIEADDKFRRYQLDGDRRGQENGSYVLRVDEGGFAVGGCQNFRDQEWHKFQTNAPRKYTAEEKAAWKKQRDEAKARQDKQREDEARSAADKSRAVWAASDKQGTNDYLTKKGITCVSEIGCRMSRGDVVVPMWRGKEMVGLQFIKPDGSKRFVAGCAKEGAYHALKGAGTDTLVVAEGMATGWAVRASLGHTVVVAFDAGNLAPAVKTLRASYPDARVIIAADHDAWTIPGNKRPDGFDNPAGDDPRWEEWRDKGLTVNTGRDKALSVAGVFVVHPPIPFDDAAKRTDFWDVWKSDGPDAIKAAFEAQMKPAPEPEPDMMGENWERDYDSGFHEATGDDEADAIPDAVRDWACPLGYNDGVYYFLPRVTGQVTEMTAGSLASAANIPRICPLSEAERCFGGDKVSKTNMALAFANAMIGECHRIGIYNPNRIRGVGAWMEGSSCVFNTGERIITQDGAVPLRGYKSPSGYLYPLSADRVGELGHPMTDGEAWELFRLCTSLHWADRICGYYLAGFLVCSVLGGVMRWRPHFHITGDSGAGKSTVSDSLVKPLLGLLAVVADGGSTEPGIRRAIINGSFPVIMDESEGNTKRDRDMMEAVMKLIRASSSGGRILNADNEYHCRSSFYLAAINPQISAEADKSRIAIGYLLKDEREGRDARFKEWEERVLALMKPGVSGRFIARLINCAHHLPATIREMAGAIRNMGGTARFADQHSALLSGAWLLVKSRAPSHDEAKEFMEKCGISMDDGAKRSDAKEECWKVIERIMTSEASFESDGQPRRATIAAMVEMVRKDGPGAQSAVSGLSDLGVAVDGDFVRIASSSPRMTRLLSDTAWANDGWNRHLMALPGAQEGKRQAFRGLSRRRTVDVPVSLVLDIPSAPEDVDLPFDEGYV